MSNYSVEFIDIEYRNILSTGNTPTTFKLDNTNLLAITGHNGGGKSTIAVALSFGLFGKPYTKVNKGDIINRQNKKKLLVTINLNANNKHYKIIRGQKPDIFEIYEDGNLIDQNSKSKDYQLYFEEEILGFNFLMFNQLICLGKATYISFMKLTPKVKRQFVEDMLGLTIISDMSAINKTNISTTKNKVLDLKSQISILDERLAGLDRLQNESANNNTKNIMVDINNTKNSMDKLCNIKDKLTTKKDSIQIPPTDEIQSKLSVTSDNEIKARDLLTKFAYKTETENGMVDFLSNNSVCKTCRQPISKEHKDGIIKSSTNMLDKLENATEDVTNKLKIIQEDKSNLHLELDQIKDLECKCKDLDRAILDVNNKIDSSSTIVKSLESQLTPNNKDYTDEIDIAKTDIKRITTQISTLNKEQEKYQFAEKVLKDDGIKAVIVNNYIPIINHIVNDTLTKLGFFVTVAFDNSFNEVIKLRGFDVCPYNTLSEGEKLRIDMAVMLAWIELGRIKSGVNSSILLLDEIFSSLDEEGTEILADLLKHIDDKRAIVIDPKLNNIRELADIVIEMEKIDGISQKKCQVN